MAVAALISLVVGLAPLLLLIWTYKYSRRLVVPFVAPGKFWQLPFIGETFLLLVGAKNDEFLNSHINRYGRVFRSVLFGSPTICVASTETVKFVLGHPEFFKSSYTPSFEVLLLGREDGSNPESSPFQDIHLALARKTLTTERVKNFLPLLNKLAKKSMESWQGRSYINTLDEASKFTFLTGAALTHDSLNELNSDKLEQLRQAFSTLGRGLWSLKIKFPGTVYYKGLIARKYIMSEMISLVDQRRAENGLIAHNDMTDAFLESHKDITRAYLAQSLLAWMFGALETGAAVLTWFILDLMLFPEVFDEVYEENQKLADLRAARPDDSVTHEDITYRLVATSRALQETMRFRSAVLFTVREATQDILHEGILYPRGWKVITWFRALHMHPDNFDWPHSYNPNRFKNTTKPNSYVPFGSGPHACPGKDLFRAEALVFAHFLITTFKIQLRSKIDPEDLQIKYWPVACPKDGVPLTIAPRHQNTKKDPLTDFSDSVLLLNSEF